MSRYNKNLGDFGEDVAADYLEKCGLKIITRNFRVSGGEIDIVALDGDTLVFAEVKTRSSEKFGLPSEAIDNRKIEHMKTAAQRFIEKNPADGEVRFDAIEIIAVADVGVPTVLKINHIKDII